ncbi:hypothetical protein DAPPUDRAFT_241580 [Daphnia pulex]|uniref:K Homology domain-containing protein n=1 Tax=Daphnia pulex TaxID=6669 RepID=E9GEL7_DAPPU|nr:hypothetical protein DAPPUDRAFT_241580 [Daphnia pulex]|eukprot:EFX82291.1 hypothetical protein DAPPUDRAFT_241580 [Daphnia pulex]
MSRPGILKSQPELEKQKRFITDITVKNIRLTNEDSRLRRKVEDSDNLIASSRAKIEELHNRLAEQKLDKVHEDLATAKRELELRNRAVTRLEKKTFRLMRNDKRLRRKMKNTNSLLLSGQAETERLRTSLDEQQLDTREFAVATRELESKNKTISELETENLRLAENDSRLRRKVEDRDRIIASSAIEKNLMLLDKERLENELSLLQSQLTDSSSKLQNVHDELATTNSELEEEKRVSTEQPGEYSISSSVETEVYADKIVITGISNKDCGRVVGRGGSNANRIEVDYYVRLSFNNGNLFISGGDAESRLAACSDVIDNLPVTMECPTINLRNNIFSYVTIEAGRQFYLSE